MRVALLYICTGRYEVFWKDFYTSCEQYFLPEADKEYFVFTDAPQLFAKDAPGVHLFHQEKLGWPYDTLMRFRIFKRAQEQLQDFDYVFYFNANALFIDRISPEDILPGPEGLVAVLHPGYFGRPVKEMTFERKQKRSTAYLKNGTRYFQGCLNGGSRAAYLELVDTLDRNVQTDLDRGIVAVWHDESHLNKYLHEHPVKALAPAFAYPEGEELPYAPKILMRDKTLLGGHHFLRETKDNTKFHKKILRKIRKFFKR
jgi:hypothetical protein